MRGWGKESQEHRGVLTVIGLRGRSGVWKPVSLTTNGREAVWGPCPGRPEEGLVVPQ